MELSTDTLGISLAGLVTIALQGLWIPGHWIPGPKRHRIPGTLDSPGHWISKSILPSHKPAQ